MPPVSRKGTHRKGSLGKALEEGLQRGGTAATVPSPLIEHNKFYEKTQEADGFLQKERSRMLNKNQEAERFIYKPGTKGFIKNSTKRICKNTFCI
ncbi:MAG: hypothetical protein ACLVDF_04655 [Acutalibacteraceae bacterium]